jgi:hypothetical protein
MQRETERRASFIRCTNRIPMRLMLLTKQVIESVELDGMRLERDL